MDLTKLDEDDRLELYESQKYMGYDDLDINKKIAFIIVFPFLIIVTIIVWLTKSVMRFISDYKKLGKKVIEVLNKNG